MHELCLEIHGEEFCIPIPILIERWKPPGPEPDPLRDILDNWIRVVRPDPDPWRQLPILATVAALADIAPTKELERALRDVAQTQMDRVAAQLPNGASLQFTKERMGRRTAR